MKRITSTLLLAAIPLAPLAFEALEPASQQSRSGSSAQEQDRRGDDGDDEKKDDDEEPKDGIGNRGAGDYDVFGRRSKIQGTTLKDRLLGGWRLTSMALPGASASGRKAQGFLHVGEAFLSLEIHALWEQNGQAVPQSDIHTTFTSEYQIDNLGRLYCSTVIGSFIDETTGQLRWERTGFEREFKVQEVLKEIHLTFRDANGENKLTFEPYLPRTGAQRDIFGRSQMGGFGETDIFGRKKKLHQGTRDIFGRPVAPEEGPGGDGKNQGEPGNKREDAGGPVEDDGKPLRGRSG